MAEIAVIDYGAGNLRSVAHAVEHVGLPAVVTADAATILKADGVILPGVGAAADTMSNLQRLDLVEVVRDVIGRGRPFFGVCMGLQALFTASEEGGEHACLDVLPGRVRRFPGGQSIPHMGWNQVRQVRRHPFFDGVPNEANFYFVHSYYVEPRDQAVVAGTTDYGVTFTSVVCHRNVMATQFHPEKSGEHGLMLYRNFGRIVLGELSLPSGAARNRILAAV
jgi:imidazole glycerol-phosphate synthase subunit HisH